MMKASTAVSAISALAAIASAAPCPTTGCNDPDYVPGYTLNRYYANLEVVANGTYLTSLQGLSWSGFQSTTLHEGIIPADCYYFGPDRNTKCHYALAAAARSSNFSQLPSLQPLGPATSFKLDNFSFALGGPAYYGPDETVLVQAWNKTTGGPIAYGSAKAPAWTLTGSAEFNYSTAIAGAVGAPVIPITLPASLGPSYQLLTFNVTTPGDAVPELYLDDVYIATYTPA